MVDLKKTNLPNLFRSGKEKLKPYRGASLNVLLSYALPWDLLWN